MSLGTILLVIRNNGWGLNVVIVMLAWLLAGPWIMLAFASTTQQKEETRLERQWLYKKINQIDCRLDRLEQKQSGDTPCR